MNILQKIKLYFKFKRAFNNIKKAAQEVKMNSETRAGWKTTEFWLIVVSNLLAITGTLKGVIPADTGAIIIASLNGIYGVLRTIAKK